MDGNPFDIMLAALREAEAYQRAADERASRIAWILKGRLRKVSSSDLADLKRELRDFNIHTGQWKS